MKAGDPCTRRARMTGWRGFGEVFGVDDAPPLTAAEEKVADRETLAARNMALVLFVANGFLAAGVEPEDLLSWGMEGLRVAVEGYDRRHRFATIAHRAIRHAILRGLRDRRRPCRDDRRTSRRGSLDVADPRVPGWRRVDDADEASALMAHASSKYRRAVELRFGLGSGVALDSAEAGRELGVIPHYAALLARRGVEEIRARAVSS